MTLSLIIVFNFSEGSGLEKLSFCRREKKREKLARDFFKRDWVDQTDKVSLGQEKETKRDFTVQLANMEKRFNKCLWR